MDVGGKQELKRELEQSVSRAKEDVRSARQGLADDDAADPATLGSGHRRRRRRIYTSKKE